MPRPRSASWKPAAQIQPRMNAKPVKNSNCHPNGLKNHWRSDHGSAGSANIPVCATSQIATETNPTAQMLRRDRPMNIGIIARTTRYIGRMSK